MAGVPNRTVVYKEKPNHGSSSRTLLVVRYQTMGHQVEAFLPEEYRTGVDLEEMPIKTTKGKNEDPHMFGTN